MRIASPRAGLTQSVGARPSAFPVDREVLRAVAMCPDAAISLLERLLDRRRGGLTESVERLVAAGALIDSVDGLRVAADVEVLRGTPPSVLRFLHERAARVLATADRSSAAATHLIEALKFAGTADAELVSTLATDPEVPPSIAADLLLAAFRDRHRAASNGKQAREWLLAAVEQLMRAGRLDQALRLLGDEIAADRGGPEDRAVLLGRLGACHAAGRPSLALEYLRRALDEHPVASAHRSWLLTSLAAVAAPLGHPAIGDLLGQAELAQRDVPSPGGDVRLVLARSGAALSRGDVPASRRLLLDADPSAAPCADAALVRVERTAVQIALGDLDGAQDALRVAAGEIDMFGEGGRPALAALDCAVRLAVGELPEAMARAFEVLRPDPTRQLTDETRLRLLAVVVEVLFRRGEVDRARSLLIEQHAVCEWPDAMQWAVLAGAAALDPDPVRHRDLLDAGVSCLDRSVRPLLLVPHQAPWLARATALLGQPERARVVAGHVTAIAGYVDNAMWRGLAAHCAALLDRDPLAAREAVARLRTTTARPALAEALLHLSQLPGIPAAEAREAAARSAALSGRIGATGDQERALRCERDLAARQRRSGPRPAHGLDLLTSREVRVAELLAAGATKQQVAVRLFLSFHTVDTHVRAIYSKLEIQSRLQLARLWDARQRSAPPC
ncbi:helix-turn-helix transcriptional regulator [Rugosimonospora africana]|uniref:HTH luxR-type domain-containing protein n=1 Tax=Rugosimonospora africana TaxID=556532 RepID=A0A8J3VUR7_9ACTN|nr:LuxR family transcriptional regulator [Rugosimonospora africana]GIH19149.1 hypothetical protein Raf01_73210 [Rugosimonospora africana]